MIDLRDVFNNINKKNILEKIQITESDFNKYFIHKKNTTTRNLILSRQKMKSLKRDLKFYQKNLIFSKNYQDILSKNPKYRDYEKDIESFICYENMETYYSDQILKAENDLLEEKRLNKYNIKMLSFLFSCSNIYFSASELEFIMKELKIKKINVSKEEGLILSDKIIKDVKREVKKRGQFINITKLE